MVAILMYLLPLTGWLVTASEVVMGIAVLLTIGTGIDYVARARALRRRTPVTAATEA